MKKILALLFSVVLIFGTAVTASAAGTSVSLSGVPTELKKDATATVTVALSGTPTMSSAMIQVALGDGLELVSGEWKKDGLIKDFSASESNGVIALSGQSTLDGTVATFVIKGKTIANKAQDVKVDFIFKNGSQQVGTASITKTVKVVCANHSYGSYGKKDNNTHTRTCSVCGNVETANHAWDSGKVTKTANCKEAGVKTYTCTACGATKTETISKTTNHTFGAWSQSKAPTCTANGEEKRTCSTCGKIETRTVNALGHSFTSPTVTKQPTCTETGVESGTCTRCGKTTTNTIKAKGHNMGAWSQTTAPTCTENGVMTRKCSSCGNSETKAVDALGHDFENPTIVKEPTISTTGLKEGKCKRCGETTSEVIPCTAKDEPTGTTFEADEGTFQEGTELKINEIKSDDPEFENVKNSLKEICGEFTLYDITAVLNGATVQPNGDVTAVFIIPTGYGTNVAVYYIAEDGTYTMIESTVSEDGRTVSAKLTHFSNYAVCKLDGEGATDNNIGTSDIPLDVAPTPATDGSDNGSDGTVVAIIAVIAAVVIAGGAVAFVIIKKKKSEKA